MASKASNPAAGRTGFLMLDTVPAALAFPAARVLTIAHAAGRTTEPPVPLSALMPVRFSTSKPEWVLRIGDADHSVMTAVSGPVRVDYLRAEELCSMPSLNPGGFEIYSDVILANGRPSALVVNIDALLRARQKLG